MANSAGFSLVDLDNGELDTFVRRKIAQSYVEFLRGPSRKPHVVFKVNLDQKVALDGNEYSGCRLSMDYTGDPGTFIIKPVSYIESSTSAAASFQFEVKKRCTIRDWVDIFRGIHRSCPKEHQSNLTDFTFIEANPATAELDGCRDFITQCMIRLHALGLVSWKFDGQAVPNIQFIDFGRFVPGNGFHDIIGNNYVLQHNSATTWGNRAAQGARSVRRRCEISRLPLHRGMFSDPGFRRIEVYKGHRLPYHKEQQGAQDTQQQTDPAYYYQDAGGPSSGGSGYGGPGYYGESTQ